MHGYLLIHLAVLAGVYAGAAAPRPAGRMIKRDNTYPANNPTTQCFDYEVLDTRGKSNGFYRPADTYPTVQGIIEGRAGGNYWENPYDTNYDLGNYMDLKTALCPATRYVLIAFSYGTRFVTTTMMNTTIDRSNVASIILYGDGYWRAGRPENRGSATEGHGAFANGNTIPADLESRTRNYCNVGDWECQNLPQNNSLNTPHHSYVNSSLQTDAIDFSLSQLDLALSPLGSGGLRRKKRREELQHVMGETSICEKGHSYCPAGESDLWSCIETDTALEHCGGCPGGLVELGFGLDCTSIEGADEVACISGICQVSSCLEGYKATDDGRHCEVVPGEEDE